jgi:predicted nucleotidyltransferase
LVVASFKEAVKKSILQVNRGLPEGQKIVALILLGSYAIGQSTPKSDIDYQLVTQDGGKTAIPLFKDALDKNWVENRLDTIEAFQFTLPPSPEVVRESFLEGYQVVSPDPAAVEAMTFPVSPGPTTAWVKVRGKLFEWAYRSWIWTNFRLMDIKDAFAR